MSAIDVDEAAEGGANRVLIVDDDVDFAEGLELLLMGEGYEIEQAHSVVEARRRLEHFNADVALIDIRLGGGDGIGLIPQLKTRRPDLLCVMMTAFASTDSVILALQRGAYDYLRKPIQGAICWRLSAAASTFAGSCPTRPRRKRHCSRVIMNWNRSTLGCEWSSAACVF